MSSGFISATCLSHGRAAFGDPIFNFIGIPSPKREKLKTPRHHAAISHSVNVPPATTEPSADLNGIPSSGCGQREVFSIHRLHGLRQSSCYSGFGQHEKTLEIVGRASPALVAVSSVGGHFVGLAAPVVTHRVIQRPGHQQQPRDNAYDYSIPRGFGKSSGFLSYLITIQCFAELSYRTDGYDSAYDTALCGILFL